MHKLIAVTGTAAETKAFAMEMFRQHGWARTSAYDPVKSATAEMFGVDLMVFHDEHKMDETNLVWGMTHREMFEGVRAAFIAQFGIQALAKRWLNCYFAISEENDVMVFDADFPEVREMVTKLGGEFLDLTGRDVVAVAAEVVETLPA